MALTERKRKFAEALLRGERKTDAARQAGYSAATASQMANKLGKDADILRYMDAKRGVEAAKEKAAEEGRNFSIPDLAKLYSDPRDFLSAVMNDAAEDIKLRVDAAKSLMPYMHTKLGEQGKKEAKQDKAAQVAGGKFAQSAPPKLIVNNGRR